MADEDGTLTLKRERSPSFPYIDLSTAIEHLEKLYKAAKMNEVRVPDVAAAWGMTEKSGSFMRYVAALGQFGLIDAMGGGNQRRVKISPDGRRILEDVRPGVREQLCSEAALKPKLIRGLYFGEDGMPAWANDRPNDSIAESSLKFDLSFTGEAARRFLTVYDATIKHVVDSGIATDGVDNQAADPLEYDEEQAQQRENVMRAPADPAHLQGKHPAVLNAINFKSDGAGTVTISATLDAEGLELLEKKIAALKLLIN